MFTGLIAHVGRVATLETDPRGGARVTVEAATAIAEGVTPKDSIAVDGVCLTLVSNDARTLVFDVVPETLVRSTLGMLRPGTPVNVELSMRLGDRLGGHFVYGHVDGVGVIASKATEGQGHRLIVDAPPQLDPYLVEKGYVAIDGVSLTIASVRNGRLEIALIPETSSRTSLGGKVAGDRVNLEIDPIARYAIGAAQQYAQANDATTDELAWAYEI
jgi:riboflavin synthase alpha subunit